MGKLGTNRILESVRRPILSRPLLGSIVLLAGCASYTPPPPPAPRDATPVLASAGLTWDAVIEVFAARNIPIRTIERVSGLIVTDNLNVGPEGKEWASCGSAGLGPTHGTYNVLVRGDSIRSMVKATVRWSLYVSQAADTECSTTHEWEQGFEDQIKQLAEWQSAAMAQSPAEVEDSAGKPAENGPTPGSRPAASPPAESTAREAAASRKAREEEAARARARLPRSNAELLRERNFQLAVADGKRLGLIDAYGETARDTLVVDLTDAAMVSSGLEYQLGRLFKGYLDNTGRSRASILELRHAGRRVGEYTWNGLARTDWR